MYDINNLMTLQIKQNRYTDTKLNPTNYPGLTLYYGTYLKERALCLCEKEQMGLTVKETNNEGRIDVTKGTYYEGIAYHICTKGHRHEL